MKAVILAGGKGTRLQHLTKDIPKPMIPVAGKPLLEHQIILLAEYNITDITILVNYLKDSIIDYFGDGSAFGVNISYYEELEPLGTVGGIKEIEESLTEDFIVFYGDVMVNMDLNRLIDFHNQKNSEATLVLHPNDHPYDSDLVDIDDTDRVTAFYPKPHEEGKYYRNLVNAALYVFSPKILPLLEKGVKADFGKDIFPKVLNKLDVFGYNTTEYLKDMGTPDRLEKVEANVNSGLVERKSLKHKQKAIFLDRDGVINPDKHLIHKHEDFELYPYTADAVKKINQSEYISVVTTNQSIIARGMATIDELNQIHNKMDTLLGNERAKLDAIYYCPHHPDSGFEGEIKEYKVDCECRKPKPGMLLQAAEKFNIDLSQSYMIGDSERDIIAGKSAGCTTIGVKTGKGIKSAKVLPNYFFGNLKEAIDFIIDEPYSSIYNDIISRYTESKKPTIITVAGNSRSGKSTLATYLQKKFEADNKSVLKVELDNWILPKERRQKEVDVFTNFQLNKIETDIKELLSGKTIKANGYKRHPEREIEDIEYTFNHQDIIIIEGIVVLGSEYLRDISDITLFKDISSTVLKERLHTFYKWKGYSDEDFEALYAMRKPIEYDIIEKHRTLADIIVQ